jgi:FkbM family methyltransferase
VRAAGRFLSYAQNHEDVVLARALRPDERSGTYIDVGAGHPTLDSVTRAFADRGWSGVNVEPLPEEHRLLTLARPDDVNLNVALGAVPGVGKLYEAPPANRGSSTMVAEYAARYGDGGEAFLPIEVRVRTLAQVTDEHVSGPVELLKIDVEGYEREVLLGADWEWFKPRVIVVEATIPNSRVPAHESWEPLLLDAGYRCALFDGLNRFYGRLDDTDVLEALAAPANVLDDYVPFEWADRVDRAADYGAEVDRLLRECEARLALVSRRARVAESELAIARDAIAELQDALATMELRTARAVAARADVAGLANHLEDELDAIHRTRVLRHTAWLRDRYAHLRRMARPGASG